MTLRWRRGAGVTLIYLVDVAIVHPFYTPGCIVVPSLDFGSVDSYEDLAPSEPSSYTVGRYLLSLLSSLVVNVVLAP